MDGSVPEEKPILDQALAALVRFAPQWIGGRILNNNNGWLEEDPDEDEDEDSEEDPEEEEIEDEDMVNDEEDDAEVINPYEEADPHNRPPPTSDKETKFAPPIVQIADADDVPIPLVIQFRTMRDLLVGNSEVYAPGPMTEKKMARKLRQNELRMNDQEFDITALYSTVRENRSVNSKMMKMVSGLSGEFTELKIQNRRAEELSRAVRLVRWVEKIENTFEISECAEGKKVKFSTATLHGRALTWWNSQVATLGHEVANGRPWTEVKQMMTNEFCPTEEVQRLEDELRHLKLMDMNIVAYMERPAKLNEAVRMAHALMEQKIEAKNERIAEGIKRKWENNNQGNNNNNNSHKRGNYQNNNHHNQNNNRRQSNARALITTQNEGVNQTRIALKCNRYGRCHFDQCPPKCDNCGRIGHKAKDCQSKNVASGATVQSNVVCYECWQRGHKSCACPKKANQRGGNVQGQAYVIRDAEHNQGPNVVTGTFLLNNRYATMLFDSGADKSFVDIKFIVCGKKEVHMPCKNKTLVVKSDSS
nr:hypothetical protein [Tanacetum cinerariifolium]